MTILWCVIGINAVLALLLWRLWAYLRDLSDNITASFEDVKIDMEWLDARVQRTEASAYLSNTVH